MCPYAEPLWGVVGWLAWGSSVDSQILAPRVLTLRSSERTAPPTPAALFWKEPISGKLLEKSWTLKKWLFITCHLAHICIGLRSDSCSEYFVTAIKQVLIFVSSSEGIIHEKHTFGCFLQVFYKLFWKHVKDVQGSLYLQPLFACERARSICC